jgi:hypothetical protein
MVRDLKVSIVVSTDDVCEVGGSICRLVYRVGKSAMARSIVVW